MAEPLVLAIDQGTSATKAVLVAADGRVQAAASAPLGIAYPRPGWVEQDPREVVASVREAVDRCLDGVAPGHVAAVGLSTQRESALVWDRRTGEPLGPLLGWQDLRTADACRALRDAGHASPVRRLSGLPLDPMFSAAKLAWLLERVDPELLAADRVAVGTVDSWLLASLTGDHVVEAGNASRTQLLDVATGEWSPELRPRGLGRLPRGSARARGASRGRGQGHLRDRLLGDAPARPGSR